MKSNLEAIIFTIKIDYGNNEPGSVLQRASITFPHASGWQDYIVDGKPVTAPIDIESLPLGEYRLVTKWKASCSMGICVNHRGSAA